MSETDHTKAKMIAVLLVILTVAGWTYHRSMAARPGAAANNGHSDEFDRPSPEEMRKSVHDAAKNAGLSPEQLKKFDELSAKMQPMFDRGSRDQMTTEARQQMFQQMREARTQMEDLMTTQQRQKMRENMQAQRSQREARTKAVLGDAQYERYRQKQQERWGGRGGRGGPGGGGPGGGGRRGGARQAGSITGR